MKEKPKYRWEKLYTVVLIVNAVYILLFYLIMQYYS